MTTVGAPELLSARDLAAVEVAAALSVSHLSADYRVELAAALGRLPGTRLALAGGRFDRVKVAGDRGGGRGAG